MRAGLLRPTRDDDSVVIIIVVSLVVAPLVLYPEELERRNELAVEVRLEELAEIESGALTAYIAEIARSPGDSARTCVLNPLNLDLPAALEIKLLGNNSQTCSGIPAPAVERAYLSAWPQKDQFFADNAADVKRKPPQGAGCAVIESSEPIGVNT